MAEKAEKAKDARRRLATVPDAATELAGEQASYSGAVLFSATLFAVVFCAVLAISYLMAGSFTLVGIVASLICAVLAALSMRVALQWEKVVVLRLGKFHRVAGPGLFFTIPIIESSALRVDGRVRVTTFGAEETLTADLVPLDVDAALFWMVWDARAACTEVSDFNRSVQLAAQTALRDAIGRGSVAEVAIRREQLDRELKAALEEKVGAWGITVLSVEVRDIVLPKELQDAMSLEAQAEQRKKARIALMEAEEDISEMLVATAGKYGDASDALRVRAMHLLYESIRETGGTVVVPSSFSEGFGDVLPDSLKRSLSK